MLLVYLLNTVVPDTVRTYTSLNQDLSVPDSLLAPVSVTYRHRNKVGDVRRVEKFGVSRNNCSYYV